jgi:light-independent protochlorophyllide reductase subunit B
MEDHLLEIFGGHDTTEVVSKTLTNDAGIIWSDEASNELKKIPGFIRGKIKRNTEKYAQDQNISVISLEVIYSAKEAIGK